MPHSCGVCLDEYDPHTKIPKNLDCGHSLCRPCLVILLKGSRWCPLCRVALTKDNAEGYQTVFQLLEAHQTKAKDDDSVGHLEELKMQLRNTKKSYERALRSNEMELRELQRSEGKLEETRKFLQQELDTTTQNLKHLEGMDHGGAGPTQQEGQVKRKMKNLSLNASENPSSSYNFNLGDFTSSEEYLRQVRARIERGKPFFAYHRRRNGLFCGKVSYEGGVNYLHPEKFKENFPNGLLKISSMTLSDTEGGTVLTPFDDLKSIVKDHFIAFLEFRQGGSSLWNWFIPLNESPLARQFLTLCTGQEGPTYLGSQIQWNEGIWSVDHYQVNGSSTSGLLPSTTSLPSKKFQNSSYPVLEGFPDGSFKIKLDRDYRAFSSKIVMSRELYGYQPRSAAPPTGPEDTILECGLALKLEPTKN